jgi:hypothetical protein
MLAMLAGSAVYASIAGYVQWLCWVCSRDVLAGYVRYAAKLAKFSRLPLSVLFIGASWLCCQC